MPEETNVFLSKSIDCDLLNGLQKHLISHPYTAFVGDFKSPLFIRLNRISMILKSELQQNTGQYKH